MIWIFVIIGIVAVMFLIDRNEEKDKVQKQGGLVIKYSILINYFMAIPEIKVMKQTDTSITLRLEERFATTLFTISHGFEAVHVIWSLTSVSCGDHSLNWTFRENQPQSTMIDWIETELSVYKMTLPEKCLKQKLYPF